MVYVLGIVAVAFVVLLAVGVLSRRVRLNSCCSMADPRHDARMRDAFLEERDETPVPPTHPR